MSYEGRIKDTKNDIYNKYNKKDQYIDVCKSFKFIRNLDTIAFNRKVNELNITHLFKGHDLGKLIEADINSAIRRRTNFVLGIIGATGSGKSEAAQRIAILAKDLTFKYKGFIPEIYICFTTGQFQTALSKIKPHDILIKDESPRTSGTGARTENHAVENVLHSVRFFQNIMIFIDPVDIRVAICDSYLESAGMNFKSKINRFLVLNRNKDYFGTIKIKLHDDEEFREIYEAVKQQYLIDLLKKGGMVKANIMEENTNSKKPIDADEDIIYLRKNYNPEELKEFDLHIYELRTKGNTLKEVFEMFGEKINKSTIDQHYYKIKNFFEKNK